MTSSGRLFQTLAPATGKERLPTVGRRMDRVDINRSSKADTPIRAFVEGRANKHPVCVCVCVCVCVEICARGPRPLPSRPSTQLRRGRSIAMPPRRSARARAASRRRRAATHTARRAARSGTVRRGGGVGRVAGAAESSTTATACCMGADRSGVRAAAVANRHTHTHTHTRRLHQIVITFAGVGQITDKMSRTVA